jgi:hypothetical protein
MLHYLRIPALFRYKAASGFSAVTGPQIGLPLSAKDEEEKDSYDIKDELKKSDFSWAFDLGYAINPAFNINARYNPGFSNFYEEEKNSSIHVGIQYRLCCRVKT